MTVKQAAVCLEVCPSVVYALCQAGVLRHARIGLPGKRGVIRISPEAIEEYRRAREVGVRAGSPASPPRKKVKLRHLKLPS